MRYLIIFINYLPFFLASGYSQSENPNLNGWYYVGRLGGGMGDYYIWRHTMSEQIKASAFKPARASKIQIEVKEVAPQTAIKNATSHLGADADGGDLSNE